MGAGIYAWVIEQGTTVTKTFQWLTAASVPIPLTGYTARLQIRETKASVATILSLTSATGGGLTITEAEGKIRVDISATVTKALTFTTAVYDLEVEKTATGVVTRLVEGSVTLNREVTR